VLLQAEVTDKGRETRLRTDGPTKPGTATRPERTARIPAATTVLRVVPTIPARTTIVVRRTPPEAEPMSPLGPDRTAPTARLQRATPDRAIVATGQVTGAMRPDRAERLRDRAETRPDGVGTAPDRIATSNRILDGVAAAVDFPDGSLGFRSDTEGVGL
jgi:hypothetical protein